MIHIRPFPPLPVPSMTRPLTPTICASPWPSSAPASCGPWPCATGSGSRGAASGSAASRPTWSAAAHSGSVRPAAPGAPRWPSWGRGRGWRPRRTSGSCSGGRGRRAQRRRRRHRGGRDAGSEGGRRTWWQAGRVRMERVRSRRVAHRVELVMRRGARWAHGRVAWNSTDGGSVRRAIFGCVIAAIFVTGQWRAYRCCPVWSLVRQLSFGQLGPGPRSHNSGSGSTLGP